MSEQQQVEIPKQKFVFEFQHTDENGQPIIDPRTGKQAFTNLVGESAEEVLEKMKDSYLNVTRAYNRSRTHKPVPKEPEPQVKQLSPEEERQAAADLQDPTKARAAVRKLTGVDDLEATAKATKDAQDKALASAAAYKFMANHLNDYYPCQANSSVISRYINENGLDPRLAENYEVAFNAVQPLLAQRPAPAAPPPPEPPKQVNGGIQPGSLSGQRPAPRKKQIVTKQEIAEMRKTKEGRERYHKRVVSEPGFKEAVDARFKGD